MDLVEIKDGKAVVSSKFIADRFKKTHRDVIRAIGLIECSDKFRAANFAQSSYTSPQNKVLKCFDMTRDGFTFLCMGFTGREAAKWKEEYISAFNKMESYIKNESNDNSILGDINKVSAKLDDLEKAGSAWGKTGHEIRKQKKLATDEIIVLVNKAQLQLGF